MAQVLIVEDEPAIADTLAFALRADGHQTRWESRATEALQAQRSAPADLVILDVGLPDLSGFEACKQLRRFSDVPVIFLTARADEVDRIVGLEMGADDYLAKPFSPRELLARIRSILRRARGLAGPARSAAHQLRFAGWTLDLAARQLLAPDGVVVALSGAEFKLLSVFAEHPNRVLDRNQLMDLTVGRDGAPFDRSIDVQVSRLRLRLRDDAREPRIIKTVRNEGYVLAAAVERLG